MQTNKSNILIITIIIIIGLFYLFTIREGHDWGGDFSAYIHHAKNIVKGDPYQNIGYIYNPSCPTYGPKTYPPFFPLLLSPLYKYYGLNLTAMKIEVILFFILFLLAVFLVFKDRLSFRYQVALVSIIGLNPYFWDFKDNVPSDIPFLSFLYLAFLFIHRTYQCRKAGKSEAAYTLLSGFFIYFAYATRNVGIVILVCIFIYELIRFKRLTRFFILSSLTCLFLIILQNIFFQSEARIRGFTISYTFNPVLSILCLKGA